MRIGRMLIAPAFLSEHQALGANRAAHEYSCASIRLLEVVRSIDEQSRSIRLPVHMVESMSRAERARAILTQELHRPPSEKELAAHLQISERKVHDIEAKSGEPISLDSYMGESEDLVLVDFIEDKSAPSPIDCASRCAKKSNTLFNACRNAKPKF